MKNFSLLLVLALGLTAPVSAVPVVENPFEQASEQSEKMRLGYTDGNMGLNLGLGFDIIMEGAIQFPASEMTRLKGNKITSLRLAVGDELSAYEPYIFISNKLEKPYLYQQTVSGLKTGWNEIRLDQPFEITGEELFIGFKYSSAGTPFSMDGRDKNDLANWIRLTQNEDAQDIVWQHQDGGSLNLQVFVEGPTLPQNDIQIEKVVAKRYGATGRKAPLSLIVRNRAAADVNSLTVTYTFEDQEPVTCQVENLSIASNELARVKVTDMPIDNNGIYNLDVRVDQVNGTDDENPQDNTGLVENIICKKDYANRKVLLEHFSTMKCNNCPTGHKTIDDALYYREDVIHVVHHAGMGKDPFTIPESEAYVYFYNDEMGGGSYAPGAMLDRTNMASYGADDGTNSTPAPVFFPQRTSFGKLVDQRLSSHALVTLDIEKRYDADTRTLTVTVNGDIPSGSVERLGADNPCLNIFLTEDSLLSDYPQAGVEDPAHYYHNNVLRKVLTDVWGDPVTFEGASYKSQEYSCVIPSEWNDRQVNIVAFLANTDKIHSNNCQVFNANELRLTADNGSGIIQTQTSDGPLVGIWQNGSELEIYGDYNRAVVYSSLGVPVQHITHYQKSIPLAGLSQGVYLIRFETEQGVQTWKFIIQ